MGPAYATALTSVANFWNWMKPKDWHPQQQEGVQNAIPDYVTFAA
jgi:hypothetical protein